MSRLIQGHGIQTPEQSIPMSAVHRKRLECVGLSNAREWMAEVNEWQWHVFRRTGRGITFGNGVVLLVCFLSTSVQAQDASGLADILKANHSQLSSVRVTYSYVQKDLPDGLVEADQTHEYRFSGDERYLAQKGKSYSVSRKRFIQREDIWASHNGITASFHTDEFRAPDRPPSGVIGQETWMIPNALTFREMLGDFDKQSLQSLESILSEGESYVRKDGEFTVLSVCDWKKLGRTDFVIDKQFRLAKILSGSTPPKEVCEEYATKRKADLLDIFSVYGSVEIEAYAVINGIPVPSKGKKIIWQSEGEKMEALDAKYRAGEIDVVDYALERQGLRHPFSEVSITVEPTQIEINPNFTDSDFQIQFPDGTLVADKVRGNGAGFIVGERVKDKIDELADHSALKGVSPASGVPPKSGEAVLAGQPPAPIAIDTNNPTQPTPQRANTWMVVLLASVVSILCVAVVARTVLRRA